MTQYRKMTEQDCEAVADLYQQCFSHPWTLAGIREMFTSEGYISHVAVDGEEIIGYVGMKTVLDEADITNVAVSPDHRKKGIAHELLKILLNQAEEMGIVSIFLEVRASNIAAITLYDHAKFTECGRRKKYYQEPEEDALVMVWNHG